MKPTNFYLPMLVFLVFILSQISIFAQEETLLESSGELIEVQEEEAFYPHHALGLVISHANVREGVVEGSRKWLSLPSWGINYNFHFHPRWAIGLHTDFIVEKFTVEKHLNGGEEGEAIERNFPVAPAIMGIYKFGERTHSSWEFEFGLGGEFSDGENFFLTRAGIAYVVEIRNHWEVFFGFAYDFKWNAYDSFVFGFGIGKAFGLPHEPSLSEEHR